MATMSRATVLLLCVMGVSNLGCGDEPPPGSDTTSGSGGTGTGTTDRAASSGSGGSAGDSAAATTGTPAGPDYYPLADGVTRVFRHTSNGGWDETITLTETAPGIFLEVESVDPDGERNESVLEVDDQGRVFRTSKQVYVDDELTLSVVYDPGFIRFDPAWLDLETGESVSIDYERTETPSGAPPDPSRPRAHEYTSLGLETVAVLGKTYRDCLVIERQRAYSDVVGEPEDQTKRFYFAPDVGKVWEINLDSGNTEELSSATQ